MTVVIFGGSGYLGSKIKQVLKKKRLQGSNFLKYKI